MNPDLSQRVKSLAPSATLAVAAKTKELMEQGIQVISLAAGEPNFSAPRLVIEASHKALDQGVDKYTAVRGTDDLVAVMREKFKRDQELEYSAQEVIATVGSKGALSLALDAILNEGDEVIILAPYWASYPELVRLSGGEPKIVNCLAENNYEPLIADIKAAITPRTKALMLNSPNNPTGAVYSKNTLAGIMAALENTQIWVISDEIYEHLVFGEHKHFSPASLSKDAFNRTLVISGVAKSYAMTGWRVGVVGGPKLMIDALVKLQSQRYTCVSSIAQSASVCALSSHPGMLAEVEKMRQAYERRAALFSKIAQHRGWGERCSKAQGAFYALLDVSALNGKKHRGSLINSDLDVALRLLSEAHVAVVAGTPFGAPGYLRISLAAADEDITQGINKVFDWLA